MTSLTLYFCPHCTGWSILNHSVCRECHRHVELSQPDPDSNAILSRVGNDPRQLGLLAIERSDLPRIYRTFATSRGLLFSPQMRKMGQKFVLADDRSLACWLSSLRRRLQLHVVQPAEHEAMNVENLLLETPAAMFISFEDIREVVWSTRSCLIRTTRRRELALKPVRRRDGTFQRLKKELDSTVTAGT